MEDNPSDKATASISDLNAKTDAGEIFTIKFFTDSDPANKPGPSDIVFFDACEKANNVKLEFEEPPIAGYTEKLQLMLASDEYPDVIMFPKIDETYKNAITSEIIIPVNDYIKNTPNIMEYSYSYSWQALKLMGDDRIFGIPRTTISRYDNYWIRADWLENVSLEFPSDYVISLDEFQEICKRFTLNDPDGNKKNDTFGLTASIDSEKVFRPMITAPFGLLKWQKYENEEYQYMDLQYSRVSPNFKNALAYNAELYKKGYLSKTGLTTTQGADIIGEFYRGMTGMANAFCGFIINLGETNVKKVDPNGRVSYIFIEDEKGQIKGSSFSTGMVGAWAITATCKAPGRAIQVLDWMLGEEGFDLIIYGKEGIDYTLENGKKVYATERTSFKKTNFVRRTGNIESVIGPIEKLFPPDRIDEFKIISDISMNSVVPSLDFGYVPNTAQDTRFTSYKKTYDEIITRICMGELPVSAYDKALEDWYKNGGEEYVKEMNEYIMKAQGK